MPVVPNHHPRHRGAFWSPLWLQPADKLHPLLPPQKEKKEILKIFLPPLYNVLSWGQQFITWTMESVGRELLPPPREALNGLAGFFWGQPLVLLHCLLFSSDVCCLFGNQGPKVWEKSAKTQNPHYLKSSLKFLESVDSECSILLMFWSVDWADAKFLKPFYLMTKCSGNTPKCLKRGIWKD